MVSGNPLKTYDQKHRFMVAHFPGEVLTGQDFRVWPPHVTIFPWFNTHESTAIDRFMRILRILERHPVDLVPKYLTELALYGPEGDVRAREIGQSTGMGVLHGLCLSAFEEFLVDDTFTAGAYAPHESEHPARDYSNPELAIVVNSLCLVRKTDKVTKTIICAERFGE